MTDDAIVDLETQAVDLAAQGASADAERLNQQLLARDPNDIRALNRLAKLAQDAGRAQEAIGYTQRVLRIDPTNQIAQNRIRRMGHPPSVTTPPPSRAGLDTDTAYTADEAFPYVAEAIDRLFGREGDWIRDDKIGPEMLADSSAQRDIEGWAARKGRTPRRIAGAIVALWSKAFTMGTSQYDGQYERKGDGRSYFYRPRQAGS